MDSETPISNFAPVPEAREEVSVAAPRSDGTSNDTVLDNTTTTPMEKENASRKGTASSKKGKTVLKEREQTERKRKATHPPTSEMALAAIKELKKRNGASVEDIHGYIEDRYGIDMKRRRHHLNNFLITGVEKGFLEQLGKSGAAGRFKIKVKQTTEKGNIKKEKMIAEKDTARKEKYTRGKGITKKEKQTVEKGTARKTKQTEETGPAKKAKRQ